MTYQLSENLNLLLTYIIFQKDIIKKNKNIKLMNKKKNKSLFLPLILHLNQKKKS